MCPENVTGRVDIFFSSVDTLPANNEIMLEVRTDRIARTDVNKKDLSQSVSRLSDNRLVGMEPKRKELLRF